MSTLFFRYTILLRYNIIIQFRSTFPSSIPLPWSELTNPKLFAILPAYGNPFPPSLDIRYLFKRRMYYPFITTHRHKNSLPSVSSRHLSSIRDRTVKKGGPVDSLSLFIPATLSPRSFCWQAEEKRGKGLGHSGGHIDLSHGGGKLIISSWSKSC